MPSIKLYMLSLKKGVWPRNSKFKLYPAPLCITLTSWKAKGEILNGMNYNLKYKSGAGFTIIEVLISLGIVTVLALGITFLASGYLNSRILTDAAAGTAAALRNAEVRAASGEYNNSWGIHFVNNATNPDYYQLFYGTSFAGGKVVSITYLASRVQFSDPTSGASKDIIFAQATGAPSAAGSVTIQLVSNTASTKTISVNSLGLISR